MALACHDLLIFQILLTLLCPKFRSLFACKPIQAGDCILKVPYSVQLALDNLHPSINSLLGEDVGNVAKLALVILLHQRLGEHAITLLMKVFGDMF
ncbi:hypothetical protein HanRHA438_Chr00c08g0847341 [Helianthus annuus]|uniref:Uncharacterized protein n=1 Tax=Helianthus annuus TaxID=4232 RepID=A0A9K3NX08_HELAN|nr:hypothetical protein HanXRQr2_Chr03g0125151 [Helianthus annuus]KAJ0594052.1 hypothetical protein HanHA300_Chr03g0104211 [Helianthus annuus]KAJ0602132.1 hypothetical protein HanIR_Chr03g0136291 [Helianthus annuus]KAJ0609070.1 hypothetical protein HanHA89_Chr03g0115821 [Helianthus annuus]KAJ0769137.1 hypothetical protein HanLR1_Chr03g0109431 [Helianthus annuus]